ncbi:hypothetical protein DVA86_18805 [Streptomyces armeniacus]|uniref:DUF748 domain-containing protein n=1 Tax=Streptomyces armeniacus TaxID=83291 RepID=A0A345XRX5_9ACTN|nr:hypothetical protein [Streptomyces armeniacus]AXK34391.1 hypothetical protein DVA86_18805 [Streptomyces armeniacus]
MNTATKIAAFAAALTATFGSAYGLGSGIDPVSAEPEPAQHAKHGKQSHGGAEERKESGGGKPMGGLQVTDQGYSFDLRTPRIEAGKRSELRFTVRDAKGRAVTAYEKEHDKELHLIVAARDLGTYRHLHPERAADGTWSTPVELPKGGDYRIFADFTPGARGAENVTLGTDLAVSGMYEPEPLPEPSRTAVVDDYRVRLEGSLKPGSPRELTLNVSRNGKPVTDLQPYLGAYGHLVALRGGDLAYLHVHPNGEPGDGETKSGPGISFTTTAPSAGSYRLFLDFKHEGRVHTAAFTVRADGASTAPQPKPEKQGDSEREAGGHQH